MNKRLNFWLILTLVVCISTITLVGLVMKLDTVEVASGDGVTSGGNPKLVIKH